MVTRTATAAIQRFLRVTQRRVPGTAGAAMDVAGDGELGERTGSTRDVSWAALVGACSGTAGTCAPDVPTLATGIDSGFASWGAVPARLVAAVAPGSGGEEGELDAEVPAVVVAAVAVGGSGVMAGAVGSGLPVGCGGSPESGREAERAVVVRAAAGCDGETAGSVESAGLGGESLTGKVGAAAGRERVAGGSAASTASVGVPCSCLSSSSSSSSPHSPSISSVSLVGGILTGGGYESLLGRETARATTGTGATGAALASGAPSPETAALSGDSALACGGALGASVAAASGADGLAWCFGGRPFRRLPVVDRLLSLLPRLEAIVLEPLHPASLSGQRAKHKLR
ncbi:MAG: hypothetical protein JW940_08795 [Polyangiaceae bacterium]|nr:hypothetical protein [Polyangiaceae bacterium]